MKPIIIALDFKNRVQVMRFLKQFKHPENLYVKIGMELFDYEGPDIIKKLRQLGVKVFLDLKLYDIPSIVGKTAEQLGRLGVQMITIHASGGSKMIRAAKQGLVKGSRESNNSPAKLLAVTILTSMSEKQMQTEHLTHANVKQAVVHLAQLAYKNGADGTISSAWEDPMIHKDVGTKFLCINPGIRLKNNSTDDQARVTTPADARQLGSNGIVVGRAITKASNSVKAYQIIKHEWENKNVK